MSPLTRSATGVALAGDGTLHAVEIGSTLFRVVLRRAARYEGAGGDPFERWASGLEQARRDGFRLDRTVVGIPSALTFRRTLSLPFRSRAKVTQVLLSQLDGEIPAPVDTVVADYLPLADTEGAQGVAVACGIDTVRRVLALLEGGRPPLAVQTDAVGLAAAAAFGGLRDGTALCCSADGVLAVRLAGGLLAGIGRTPAPPLAEDLPRRVAELAGEVHRGGEVLLVCAGDLEGVLSALRDAGVSRVRTAGEWAFFRESPAPAGGDPGQYIPALGLALRAMGRREGVAFDLRQGPFRPVSAAEGLAVPALRAALLGVAALALWSAQLLHGVSAAKAEYEAYAGRLRASFSSLLPDVRVVSEVAQLQERIDQMDRRSAELSGFGGPSALGILSEFSRAVPPQADLRVDELSLDAGRLRLDGSVGSFDAVDQVRSALEKVPAFSRVTVQNARVGAEAERVMFRLQVEVR